MKFKFIKTVLMKRCYKFQLKLRQTFWSINAKCLLYGNDNFTITINIDTRGVIHKFGELQVQNGLLKDRRIDRKRGH